MREEKNKSNFDSRTNSIHHYIQEMRFILSFFFVITFCWMGGADLYCQSEGYKYLRNYSYNEYNLHPQNWGMVQAENGLIYVANQGGVLEYDGNTWRVIALPKYAAVRSLAIDGSGTIYVGGNNDFGYLAPDAKGSLKYISLLAHVDEKYRAFSTVWKTHVTKEGIYFRTSEYIFRWDSKTFKVLKPDHRIYGSYYCNEELFVFLGKVGLVKLTNDSFEPIPGGKELDYVSRIFMIVPYDSQRLLIGTISRDKSFFIYDGKKIKPFPVESQDDLNRLKAYHGIRLTSGDYAVATRLGGLIILDRQGNLKQRIDKNYDLQINKVNYVFQDKQENLWLCLEKGITIIDYSSPISVFDERSNLEGIVLSVVRNQSELYVGTTTGLYYLESPLKFHSIPIFSSSTDNSKLNIETNSTSNSNACYSLLGVDNGILAATTKGLFHIKKNMPIQVNQIPSYILTSSKHHPNRIWCGTSTGLLALDEQSILLEEEKGKEEAFKPVSNVTQSIYNIVEDTSGNLWLATDNESLIKVEFSKGPSQPSIKYYNNSHGLPEGHVDVAMVAGHMVATTQKDILRFDKKSRSFIPDQIFGPTFSDGLQSVFRIVEDERKNIWFHSKGRNYQAVPINNGGYKIISEPFRKISIGQVNKIYVDPKDSITWFAGFDGLIRYDSMIKKNYQQDFSTLIRRVLVNEKKVIFDDYRDKTGTAQSIDYPVFDYSERNLTFKFSATYFDAVAENSYQCLLEGYEGQWSAWSKTPNKTYTNLSPGLYTFRVRSQNVYGHIGREDVFQFKILLPWYQKWWAYLIYIIGFLFTIFLFAKWRAGKLEKEKSKLKQIVKERTQEIEEKNRILEDQTIKLIDQSDKLKEMNRIKSRFFANISHEFRTPLTLIMSPLDEMRDNCRNPEQKEEVNLMLRNARRLLRLINQLLDLSRFDSGKMKLQAARQDLIPFLKGITSSFQALARKAQLSLEFHADTKEIYLYFDRQKMEEAIINLVSNAVKFTPPGGKITVSTSQETSEGSDIVKISVRDTGTGISNKQMAHIFDRFYQAEGLTGKSHKGTGIGLALAKDIIDLHSGIINVHSSIDEGTEFMIMLPMGSDHLTDDQIITEILPKGQRGGQPREIETLCTNPQDENVDVLSDQSFEPFGDNVDESKILIRCKKDKVIKNGEKVILVIEDDHDVRKYIRGPLQKEYTVFEAPNGIDGIQKARRIMPDLIVSDIMMPELNGLEMCKQLKENIETSHIPIILLTAKTLDENIVEGLEMGADDYITKPFNTKILLIRIKNLIDLREQFQKKIQRQKMLMPDKIAITYLDQEFFKTFQKIIEGNLQDPNFTIDVLCERLDMGRSTLFKKIKALTGETPNQYILSFRLERGAQLLKQKYGNVTDVAIKVGFSSPAYFAKCFKDKFHISPLDYQAIEALEVEK